VWDRAIDDGEEGDGEKPKLEGDPGDIFTSEISEAVWGELVGKDGKEDETDIWEGYSIVCMHCSERTSDWDRVVMLTETPWGITETPESHPGRKWTPCCCSGGGAVELKMVMQGYGDWPWGTSLHICRCRCPREPSRKVMFSAGIWPPLTMPSVRVLYSRSRENKRDCTMPCTKQ